MKKFISMILIALLMIVLFCACGSGGNSDSMQSTTPTTEQERKLQEFYKKQDEESTQLRSRLQEALDVVNNKLNKNYQFEDSICMDYEVMVDATELCEKNDNLTNDEREKLKYYLNNFVISILPEDPLRQRINKALGVEDETEPVSSLTSNSSGQ